MKDKYSHLTKEEIIKRIKELRDEINHLEKSRVETKVEKENDKKIHYSNMEIGKKYKVVYHGKNLRIQLIKIIRNSYLDDDYVLKSLTPQPEMNRIRREKGVWPGFNDDEFPLPEEFFRRCSSIEELED